MTDSDLDPIAILAALGVTEAASAERVYGGWDTVIWRVERAGVPYALRVFRAEQVETCRVEVMAMRVAAEGGIPVPHVQAEGMWRDRPALLLSWCHGRPLREELDARPWRAWTLGREFGRMLARIHAVPVPETLHQYRKLWIEQIGPDEEPLRAHLHTLDRGPVALLHLDYHPLNVMTDGARLTAILDWANARVGDPRADLARTFAILRFAPTLAKTHRWLTVLLGRVLELGCSSGYRQVAGPPQNMAPFHAWAWAMLACDVAPRLGDPNHWLRQEHLDRMRQRSAFWKRRAGIPA